MNRFVRFLKHLSARLLLAVVAYGITLGILTQVHDYPQLLNQLKLIRADDPIAVSRKWLVGFYFINEASSGIKFFLTGNERHFRFFPSGSHLLSHRISNEAGDWQKQYTIARMYYCGELGIPHNRYQSLLWLDKSLANAPDNKQEDILSLMEMVKSTPYSSC